MADLFKETLVEILGKYTVTKNDKWFKLNKSTI